MKSPKTIIQDLLAQADIEINGSRPWDIQVFKPDFYRYVLRETSLGLGESYMAGWWTCPSLDELFSKILRKQLDEQVRIPLMKKLAVVSDFLSNPQSRKKALHVIDRHYNPSGDVILSFLDPYNQYTCGYFKRTEELDQAQEDKLELICSKLQLNEKDHVLDIGCGWGGFAKFAAERYGCQVTGISISGRQVEYAREFCRGLPVHIEYADYRNFNGSFSKVLVCGMIEHVGYKNYRRLMEQVHACLSANGLFLLHTIGGNTSTRRTDVWIDKYIFPHSMIPSLKQLTTASEGLFVLEDLHNFGPYYDPTLMAWYKNLKQKWHLFKDKYDDSVFRMWEYYLLSCAGTFRARTNQLWQFVFSKNGLAGGYESVR